MLRQDFIGRLIQQLSDSLARAFGHVQKGELEQAEGEILEAEEKLGLPRGMDRLDARSAALLLGGGDKVVLAAALFEQRALIADARDDAALAKNFRARARSLLDSANPHELRERADEIRLRLVSAKRA
jgi:hypothetical protein